MKFMIIYAKFLHAFWSTLKAACMCLIEALWDLLFFNEQLSELDYLQHQLIYI